MPGFPNQNVVHNRFLINHPQLSVQAHQKQTYEEIIRLKYQSVYPSFDLPYNVYQTIYKPAETASPV